MFDLPPRSSPEIKGIQEWVNSDPLTLEGLKGKVVLIDFWTYSCINCLRTQPYLNAWYDKYRADGFEIVGVHTPEFEFEKMPDNVRRAVKDLGMKYPVALDNKYATWNAFDNHYWPAKYLINQDGKVIYTHFGEGAYDEMERMIQDLLMKRGQVVGGATDDGMWHSEQTPETYLGYERGRNFANASEFTPDKAATYTVDTDLMSGQWSLGGTWKITAEGSTTTAEDAMLRMQFSAREVYLVIDGPMDANITLKVNDKAVTPTINGGPDVAAGGRVHLNGARLYRLVKLPVFAKNQSLEITFPKGVTVNAFTFGG